VFASRNRSNATLVRTTSSGTGIPSATRRKIAGPDEALVGSFGDPADQRRLRAPLPGCVTRASPSHPVETTPR
jgi:hypothetical protein